MALNAPYTPNTLIQSTQVSNDLVGLANGSNDTSNNSMSTYRTESNFDYVASGCIWSGDAYASTRNASQTSGVVYIGGVRLTVSAVSARSFTASKDTYIDINGSGVQVYTEATNNAASPALAAGSIRIGIIVTGASTIAAAGSVNQGQETIVLPIASSSPYAVTDSLGNLICSRDVNRKILGYRPIIANVTGSSTTQTQATGLSVPVIIPANRKIRITFYTSFFFESIGPQNMAIGLWDGTVPSGTQLQAATVTAGGNGFGGPVTIECITTPTATSKTYNIGISVATNGIATITAGAIDPAFVKVELE